jgi:hypothetical protein
MFGPQKRVDRSNRLATIRPTSAVLLGVSLAFWLVIASCTEFRIPRDSSSLNSSTSTDVHVGSRPVHLESGDGAVQVEGGGPPIEVKLNSDPIKVGGELELKAPQLEAKLNGDGIPIKISNPDKPFEIQLKGWPTKDSPIEVHLSGAPIAPSGNETDGEIQALKHQLEETEKRLSAQIQSFKPAAENREVEKKLDGVEDRLDKIRTLLQSAIDSRNGGADTRSKQKIEELERRLDHLEQQLSKQKLLDKEITELRGRIVALERGRVNAPRNPAVEDEPMEIVWWHILVAVLAAGLLGGLISAFALRRDQIGYNPLVLFLEAIAAAAFVPGVAFRHSV